MSSSPACGRPQGEATTLIARVVRVGSRFEVRCPVHNHLLGILSLTGTLEIKCRRHLVVVALPSTSAGADLT